MSERIEYDEMSMFHENAEEFGLPWTGPPTVSRQAATLADGRQLSGLVWGAGPADIVFLHGGAQNAHTWDTVALALGRPLLALDLPGHGHSDRAGGSSLDVFANAADVAAAVEQLADPPVHLVGMSLGGMTALALADTRPDLVSSLALVDITPGVNADKSSAIVRFVAGPPSFDSFDEILARTVEFNPTRTVSSLRRGILHNAVQREDGTWAWRYARFTEDPALSERPDFGTLWDAVGRVTVPLLLARGMAPGSVVDDADEQELLRRNPTAQVARFPHSGHSIQGDEPVPLATTLASFFATP